MEGFLRDDPQVAEAFGEGRLLKKDRSFKKNTSLTHEEFLGLSRLVRSLLRREGSDIMAGRADISPARSTKTRACQYRRYHCICGFDPTLPGHSYRPVIGDAADLRRRPPEEDVGES
jgi:ATP-dependent helicase/nuclease subunit B